MPVNNTDTKPTHKTIRILPHVQAALLLQNVQQMHWLSLRPRPARLFACTVQPYSVLRHTQILWQFDKLRVQQNCIGKDRTSFLLLFVILNKLSFLMHTKKPDCRSTFVRKAVSAINKVSKHRIWLLCSTDIWFPIWNTLYVTAVSQVQAGLHTWTLRISMLYSHYGLVLNPEHSVYQCSIPTIDQFRTLNSPHINALSPL